MNIEQEILDLKAKRNALILAHNYTRPEVQDIADFVGDSLELSRKAAECHAPVIVFCGVRFMAETAKLLSPESIVLHPNPRSGCPMADMASPEDIRAYRAEHLDTLVVAYVNTTAATKTEVDICCTSGNAEKLVAALPSDKQLLFVPDANLGANIAVKLGRHIELWPGCCPTHNKIMPEHITEARKRHPNAIVLVHPECLPAVVKLADHALSTGGMLRFVHESPQKEFIIGTEGGILHRMRKENPDKVFWPVDEDAVCPNMKKATLEKVRDCLRDMSPRVTVPEDVASRA